MDKHHVIPKYMGGSDRMDNLVEVSRTCHVMWHFANWQLWGNKEDYIAYRGLSGSIDQDQINREVSRLIVEKQIKGKVGIFGLSLEDRKEHGRKGGLLGGKVMGDYKWITNGKKNSRIPKLMDVPEGWKYGVTRKKERKNKPKYGTRKDWNQVQLKESQDLMRRRKEDLERVDLSARGSIAALSRMWGISHSQVRRYLDKIGA